MVFDHFQNGQGGKAGKMANDFTSLVVTNEKQEQAVSGRRLHEVLEIATPYHIWFPRMAEYGFVEGDDFLTEYKNVFRADGVEMPQKEVNHILSLDMAKHIAMVTRNEKGQMIRSYFIAVEKEFNSPEKVMARALRIADGKIRELTAKIEEDRPKVVFADAVAASRTSILVGDLAKLLRQNDFEIGQNRLFEWLRKKGYLGKSGSSYNMPTQRSMELGLLEIKEGTVVNPDGSIRTTRTPKVTGKGQEYFINKFLGKDDEEDGKSDFESAV